MYVCKDCDAIFNDTETEWIDDDKEYGEVCPYCGSTNYMSVSEELDRF